MKVGILTYHMACNYGANLQALSTLCYFKNHGYEAVFINWATREYEKSFDKTISEIQAKEHKIFREACFTMTRRCYIEKDVADVIEEENIDAIVVGSDAVLKSQPFFSRVYFPCRKIFVISKKKEMDSFPNVFWGSFVNKLHKSIPICMMSVSSQNSPYKKSLPFERRIQRNLLKQFCYISTRDDWTSNMVSYLTRGEIKPKVTPDPVFAFNYNVESQPSEQAIRERFGLKGKYALFCFHSSKTVSVQWLEEMKNKMSKRNVECVAFPFPEGIQFKHPFNKEINLPLSPIDWYALIKYASYYVGENMHPIVICLHNAVPCFSFDHYGIVSNRLFVNEKSSKIYHILKTFGCLENRISIKGLYKTPSVDKVISLLDSFERDAVRKKSEEYMNEYKLMMKEIESQFCQSCTVL